MDLSGSIQVEHVRKGQYDILRDDDDSAGYYFIGCGLTLDGAVEVFTTEVLRIKEATCPR